MYVYLYTPVFSGKHSFLLQTLPETQGRLESAVADRLEELEGLVAMHSNQHWGSIKTAKIFWECTVSKKKLLANSKSKQMSHIFWGEKNSFVAGSLLLSSQPGFSPILPNLECCFDYLECSASPSSQKKSKKQLQTKQKQEKKVGEQIQIFKST